MEEDIHGSIGGRGLEDSGLPSRTFARGRMCAEPGCDTWLSIYNQGSYCAFHESRTRHTAPVKKQDQVA